MFPRRGELQARVSSLQATTLDITPQEREKKKKLFSNLRSEWQKRKRLCNDAVGNLADSMDKKPSEMAKIIGIETDEDANISVPPVLGGGGCVGGNGGGRGISFKRGRPIIRLATGTSSSSSSSIGRSNKPTKISPRLGGMQSKTS
jgi:hypothetical protein